MLILMSYKLKSFEKLLFNNKEMVIDAFKLLIVVNFLILKVFNSII